ncbi:MAG: ATP-dependent Clp protease adaptor ClpS [Candidatus Kryptoniota bacterium]
MGQYKPSETEDADTLSGNPSKVILYNDDWHTFDEVIAQIVKAIGCSTAKAEAITIEAHTRGKALVYEGDMAECLRVNSVLEEIGLTTEIEV